MFMLHHAEAEKPELKWLTKRTTIFQYTHDVKALSSTIAGSMSGR
jgi:hypothetical protein